MAWLAAHCRNRAAGPAGMPAPHCRSWRNRDRAPHQGRMFPSLPLRDRVRPLQAQSRSRPERGVARRRQAEPSGSHNAERSGRTAARNTRLQRRHHHAVRLAIVGAAVPAPRRTAATRMGMD